MMKHRRSARCSKGVVRLLLTGALVSMPHAVSARAGLSANVFVIRDPPDEIVEPGETIPIMIRVTWESAAYQFAGLRGDTIVTGDLGNSQVPVTPYWHPGTQPAWVKRGTPRGGSIIDTDIANLPGFFTASPLAVSFAYLGMPLIVFDWTAPMVSTPTVVNLDFRPYDIAPRARFYPSQISPAWIEAETFYHGTSILVLPNPPGVVLLAFGAMGVCRRRRA